MVDRRPMKAFLGRRYQLIKRCTGYFGFGP
jgi:hypothetical protein